jgi:hypothetical protein
MAASAAWGGGCDATCLRAGPVLSHRRHMACTIHVPSRQARVRTSAVIEKFAGSGATEESARGRRWAS